MFPRAVFSEKKKTSSLYFEKCFINASRCHFHFATELKKDALWPACELFQGALRVKEVQLAVAFFTAAATRTMVHMTNIFWFMPRMPPPHYIGCDS